MNALVKCAFLVCAATAASGYNLGASDVVFHFFSVANPTISQPLLPTQASILTSNFGLGRRTIITVHDFGEGVGGNFNAFVIPAHLSVEDVNILAVDWSVGASMYSEGLGNAPQCGERIATFIDLLVNTFNYNQANIRIVGVGLGGHIAGIAARVANAELTHIVALDPSLIGWTHNPDILNPDDADVVEVLHTTAGLTGYDYPLGDLDFYPNGGSYQTGCFVDIACSRVYAYAFYSESITRLVNGGNEFIGTACDSYESAISLSCNGVRDIAFGGTETKSGRSGIYTFLTNSVPPFALG